MENERKEMIMNIEMYLMGRVERLEKFDEELRNFVFDTLETLIKKYNFKLSLLNSRVVCEYLDNLNLVDSIMCLIIKVMGLENELYNTSNC